MVSFNLTIATQKFFQILTQYGGLTMIRMVILIASTFFASFTLTYAAGDIENGEKVYKKCKACHMVGIDAKNRVGPPINGIVNQEWGAIPDFKYSKPLLEGKKEGRTWDVETLDAYLKKPKDIIPKGKMVFAGLKKDQDRVDVIEYLKSFNADGSRNN